jgi:UDP-2,3-diacylglucosamine pyrophosphatase LpxH
MLRKFEGLKMGSLNIVNKVVLQLDDGKKAWIFHGDVFDVTMQHSKWLAKLGAVGYDILILLNRFVNFISKRVFNKGKISLAQKIKHSVKSAVSFINDFEQTSADIGINNKFNYVVCGHIHHPEIRTISNVQGSIQYLNSGDWIENLSSLEYSNGEWTIYRFNDSDKAEMELNVKEEEKDPNVVQLFDNMLNEFKLMKP